ncbi:MAG: VIT1/CCC1 transporter family protein [Candidatus Kerfeldbacteria bacterium]
MKYLHHEIKKQGSIVGKMFSSMREIVFGLEDGVVSTLGAITGIAGGVLDDKIVILSGIVIIFVESLSMAAGTFLSSKAEREGVKRIFEEERQEIKQNPEAATKELAAVYKSRGFTENEIDILVARVTQNVDLWVNELTDNEIQAIPKADKMELGKSLFMLLSYVIGGLVPLSAYFFLPIQYAIAVSVIFSVAVLFVIGYTKGKIVNVNRLRSGLEMLVISTFAAAIGYAVGRIAALIFNI